MPDSMFYNDDTKLKDLTVGQLKDIIVETLNTEIFRLCAERERRVYEYKHVYEQKIPVYPDPHTTVYCSSKEGISDSNLT